MSTEWGSIENATGSATFQCLDRSLLIPPRFKAEKGQGFRPRQVTAVPTGPLGKCSLYMEGRDAAEATFCSQGDTCGEYIYGLGELTGSTTYGMSLGRLQPITRRSYSPDNDGRKLCQGKTRARRRESCRGRIHIWDHRGDRNIWTQPSTSSTSAYEW